MSRLDRRDNRPECASYNLAEAHLQSNLPPKSMECQLGQTFCVPEHGPANRVTDEREQKGGVLGTGPAEKLLGEDRSGLQVDLNRKEGLWPG